MQRATAFLKLRLHGKGDAFGFWAQEFALVPKEGSLNATKAVQSVCFL